MWQFSFFAVALNDDLNEFVDREKQIKLEIYAVYLFFGISIKHDNRFKWSRQKPRGNFLIEVKLYFFEDLSVGT